MNFEYPQIYSKVRENYLVNYLDTVESAEILKTKALITANLMALPKIAKEANKEAFDIFKTYAELLLPKPVKSAKLKEMTAEEKAKTREKLKAFKKQMDASLPKPKKFKHKRPN